MSRIFDALQRSGTEQSGIEYPDLVSVVTEVFEAPREQRPLAESATILEPPVQPTPVQPVFVQPAAVLQSAVKPAIVQTTTTEPFTKEVTGDGPVDFPSLEVSVTPSSKLVFLTEPDSLAAEKFRFLAVRLRQLQQNRPLKKVLITSTIPEEGKSMIAANLACTLGRRQQQRTLILEGDLRRPTVARQLGLGRVPGLTEW